MSGQRRAGIIQVQVDGAVVDAKGDFEYSLGHPKREAIQGADGIHDYKEVPQVPYIAGKVTDRKDLDLKALVLGTAKTVVLQLANGKGVVLRNAWYASEGKVSTGEGEIEVRWESSTIGEEI